MLKSTTVPKRDRDKLHNEYYYFKPKDYLNFDYHKKLLQKEVENLSYLQLLSISFEINAKNSLESEV